ncbi:hypothetical protein TURU_001206 [Turdus rufiventris]|nr:hypothetical protein TURU_001206 [Turdus rufiventris]
MPNNPPDWDPNEEEGRRRECRTLIVRGTKEAVPRASNVKLAFDSQQEKDESPNAWLDRYFSSVPGLILRVRRDKQGLESNLLGRDLQVQLKIGVVPEGKWMVVKMMVLKEEVEKGINPKVCAEGGGYGLLDISPIEIKMKPNLPPIRVKQ